MKRVRLHATPITEETFKRQRWKKHLSEDYDIHQPMDKEEEEENENKPYFFTLSIPKDRVDRYAPHFVSNSSDELEALRSMGLQQGQYFVEMLDTDGLGFCTTEEELEILYRALTGKYIEE